MGGPAHMRAFGEAIPGNDWNARNAVMIKP
jgi:hypothetical protein